MILLTGATGQNGNEIARQLAIAGVPFKALSRDPGKTSNKLPTVVEVVAGDFADVSSLDQALDGVDSVLLLSSVTPNQTDLQNNMVAAARRAGVHRIVKFSAMDADPNSPLALNRWHGLTERAIEDSGIAFTHLRPNSLFQNVLRSKDMIVQGVLAAPLGNARVSLVDLRDVAAVAVVALTTERLTSQAVEMTGPAAVTQNELADALAAALGHPVAYQDVSPKAARDLMLQAGAPEWAVDVMAELNTAQARGEAAVVTDAVPNALGRPAISVEEAMRNLAPALSRRAEA